MDNITTETEAIRPLYSEKHRKPELPDGVPFLQQIYLYITGGCNLNCRHCWIEPHFGESTDEILSKEKIENIVKQGLPLGLNFVKITGGEPFLHKDLCEIIKNLSALGLRIGLETNGTLIGPKEASVLRENNVTCSVSLDGPNKEIHEHIRGVRGAFEKTINGIKELARLKHPFQLIMSLYRGNADCIREMAQLASEHGANSLKVNIITTSERSDRMKQAEELLSVPEVIRLHDDLYREGIHSYGVDMIFDVPPAFKKLSAIKNEKITTCKMLNMLGILHNGHGGICGISSLIPELDFGDVLESGLKKIWVGSEVLQHLRNNFPDNIKGICSRCIFNKGYCRGKCVACTFRETGDLLGGFSFCEEAYANGLFPTSRIY